MKNCCRFILLIILSFYSFIASSAQEVPSECIHSLHNLYKFYYHEIIPSEKHSCQKYSETLDDATISEMRSVFEEVKGTCPAEIIAQVHQTLRPEEESEEEEVEVS